jgi:hypothetical protein
MLYCCELSYEIDIIKESLKWIKVLMLKDDISISTQWQQQASLSFSDNFYKHHHQWFNSKDHNFDTQNS